MKDSITPTKRRVFLVLLLIGVAVLSADLKAQRRRGSQRPQPASARVDYSRFLHKTTEHQGACDTCHKAPTTNWKTERGFPDIADYPGHDACVRCHRPQFFKGAKPVICSNCHLKVSPKDDDRLPFGHSEKAREFKIIFPHNKHQDVIAMFLPPKPPGVARTPDDSIDFNNCTICHRTNEREFNFQSLGWTDKFSPKANWFKTAPTSHAACFNCHWKDQPPTRNECAGCHQREESYQPLTAPVRYSMKFDHEGGKPEGGQKKHHQECTTCHINITRSASVKGLKPDVPITACSTCHNSSGSHTEIIDELDMVEKDHNFVCSYCHTSDVGKRDAKLSHFLVTGKKLFSRKDPN